MGPGPVRAADEKATSVGQQFTYIVPWVFFSVKKSDDESNFDGLSVRMQNTAKKSAIITKREYAEKECLVYFYHRIQYYICQGAKMKKLDLTLTNVMMMK